MTYLQRIDWLDKKIQKAKEKLSDIELWHGQNAAYNRKQMEIEEWEHLKAWYNSKIVQGYEARKYSLCRVLDCKYYLHSKCFLGKVPKDMRHRSGSYIRHKRRFAQGYILGCGGNIECGGNVLGG